MKKNICIFLSLFLPLLTACDDGHVDDKVFIDENECYNVVFTGDIKGTTSWPKEYSIVIAGFNEESDYSVIQKSLPLDSKEGEHITISMSNISTECTTIEIAAVTSLRARVATLYSYSIDASQRTDDTIRIDAGYIDATAFSAINKSVFNDSYFSCARCHSGEKPIANLDLSSEYSYNNLVNVQSKCNPEMKRVTPGDAGNSILYKAITDGACIRYSHPSLFTESNHTRMINLIESWINEGAKR
ncbi:MAG: hypothetical protein KBT29_12030 [Prevotellaceae bacterium]|nr:hypothetical protein [Candidatus Minthosoma caballi]